MSAPQARRGFLCGLIGLPLVGGSLSLIGKPTAAAVPVTADLLEAYKTWLFYEGRALRWEMAGSPLFIPHIRAAEAADVIWRTPPTLDRGERMRLADRIDGYVQFHGDVQHRPWDTLPSTRAAAILSAAGCDWRARR